MYFFCILNKDNNELLGGVERMGTLSFKNINKVYPNGFHAVKDFNLEVADKEFIIFVSSLSYQFVSMSFPFDVFILI